MPSKPRATTASEPLLEYPPLLRTLLTERGFTQREDAERFLNPEWEREVHDPFLLKDMEKVCARLAQAFDAGERIAIWSDYDMDGIPGAVVLWDLFQKLGYKNVVHYTPHRNRDGFGLNTAGLDALKKENVALVITVDCGIGDVEQVAYANSIGLEVVVTDHHLPGKEVPGAFAIINPKQEDCSYPEPMLCGAGVAFKLAQGLLAFLRNTENTKYPLPPVGWERWLLDMVGMSTIADMVPLTGENRAFAYYGLVVLRKSRRPGLQALLKKARARQQYLTEEDIGFTIAPRINAASRMGHAKDAFLLLAADDVAEAGALADELEHINAARKGHVAAMVKEARSRLETRSTMNSVLVLGNPEWKPSLLGLVAGTLAEEYERPVFLWGREEGITIKGSCRSYNNTNLFEMMQEVKTSFIECGGHAFSGGFSIEEANLHTLEEALSNTKVMTNNVGGVDNVGSYIDMTPSEISWDTHRQLAQCAPFGVGNPRPMIRVQGAVVASSKTFGKANEHLEVAFQRDNGSTFGAIAFFTNAENYDVPLTEGATVDLYGHLEASYFKRSPELRMRITNIKKN